MTSEAEFNPSRLTLARKRRGMTMTKLASRIGVDLRSVSAYEKGEYQPEDDKVDRLVKTLFFPRTFFYGPDLDEPTPDIASFRALKRMTAAQRDTALGSGALAGSGFPNEMVTGYGSCFGNFQKKRPFRKLKMLPQI